MKDARLGATGMKVSLICLGCMGLGIAFFDAANVYSLGKSEEHG